MTRINKGAPKRSEDRARSRQEAERLRFERQKLHEEHLRAELRDIYITHREIATLFFKVFLYASLASGALGSLFITIGLSHETRETRIFETLVAIVGLYSALFFALSQRFVYKAFKQSRKLYLYPARQVLGLPKFPNREGLLLRRRLEGKFVAMTVVVHLFYITAWALLLTYALK
jgi:hypothetical protein